MSKEELEKRLQNLPYKSFYHFYSNVNGEVKIYDEIEYENWLNAEVKTVAEWSDGYNSFGHFDNDLLVSKTRLYLRRVWNPNSPYCWEETQLYVLK